ncbi:MAG: hypothetical protein WBP45_04780 [Daejeonella sp.]
MYKLTKEKNIGLRIVIGIAILFAITQTLKFFLREPSLSINDELIKTANEINKHAPIVIDSVTTLETVTAYQGNTFQYNYTIQVEKTAIDTVELARLSKENFIEILNKNPKANYLKENNIQLQANYKDKNGEVICNVVFLPKEYKEKQ